MKILLKKINPKNFKECIDLKVAPEQESFVASNVYSIAQTKVYPTYIPRAVYYQEQMVGFVMYGFDEEENKFFLGRLMIAAEHQGKGFGKAATLAVIKELSQNPECREIYLSYVPENSLAKTLYKSVGFFETGEINEGEVVMKFVTENHLV